MLLILEEHKETDLPSKVHCPETSGGFGKQTDIVQSNYHKLLFNLIRYKLNLWLY